jgi:dTDP-4-dehydrorhamnose reductase
MIGRELRSTHGLVEWFLSQQGKTIRGFRRAVFSGFTTVALAEIIARLIVDRRDLQGIWHVAAEPIDKFTLLSLVKDVYGLDVGIEPDESFLCDRSLDATRFRCATGFVIPTWPDMIRQMYQDATPYEQIRRAYAHQ